MSRTSTAPAQQRRTRSDGARTRAAILRTAAELATVEGLEGLTIGGLASAIGMSKSGLYAHFGSKEDLQLATIGHARQVFHEAVVSPALERATASERLLALADNYLEHLRVRVFPGGCFFAGAALEMGTRPGAVRDQVAAFQGELSRLIMELVGAAQADGQLVGEDPRLLAFEVNAVFLAASASFVLTDDPRMLDVARTVLHRRLGPAEEAQRP